jgi:hypothetical protein
MPFGKEVDMRLTNALTVMVLMVSGSLYAQNTPATAAPKPLQPPQARVFVPTATQVPVAAMQRRVAPATRPELQQIATPIAPVVSPKPRPEPELVIPAAAPATAHGSGQISIDFRDGQLSVTDDDAELGKVLHEIGDTTGASVEVAPEVAGERVIAHLGPGPAAEIVSSLLSSPRIDFILMGSEDQDSIKRLIVRRKASFGKELPQARPASLPDSETQADETEPQVSSASDQPVPEPTKQTPPQ